MALNQANTIVLDYPLQRNSVAGNVAIFAAGTYYPYAADFVLARWDFGDGTVLTTHVSAISSLNAAVTTELSRFSGFLPNWQTSIRETAAVASPTFLVQHQYTDPGTYEVQVSLTTRDNIQYVGKPSAITIASPNDADIPPAASSAYTMPFNWESISQTYIPSDGADLIFTGNKFPQVTTSSSSISRLPARVTFNISNIIGLVNIDYIEWVFGDGSSSVSTVRGAPVTYDLTTIEYSYQILPTDLNYTPSVILYVTKGASKYKVSIQSRDIVFTDRTNIGVSYAVNGTKLTTYAFNIVPSNSDTLPVESTFIVPVTRELKYVFWNHDDGTYDVTPVYYDEEKVFVNQYVRHSHTYNSVNVNKYLPGCVLVFVDSNGRCTSEYHRLRNYLNYDKSLVRPETSNYFIIPLVGVEGYSKFNNISVLPVYDTTGKADIRIRLSLGFPEQIYLFDKIIWTINGVEIIQNKNTAKDFGYITIPNITVPYANFSIIAELYGYPSIFSTSTLNELRFYRRYNYTLNIKSSEEQLAIKENTERILSQSPPPLPPVEVFVTGEGDIVIITPVLESTSTIPVTSFIALTGRSFNFNKLFEADAPASNFLNRDFPSTASIGEATETASKREVGYFTPSQTSNIIVEPGQFTFTVELDTVEFNKPYYFPDPFRYGSDTPALKFSFNEDSFKNGGLFTIARNRPNTSDDFITFDGYTSTKQINPEHDIDDIVNSGYFHNFVDDIYGNRYGLLKANNFESGIVIDDPVKKYTVVFNGYKFFDSYLGNGYNFNYYTPLSVGNELLVPGLSTYTGTLTSTASRYTLNFGAFNRNKYTIAKEPFDVTTQYLNPISVGFRDCASFIVRNGVFLQDSVSSDLSAFTTTLTGVYYYSELYEGGVFKASPYQRPLLDTSSSTTSAITARFTESVRVSGDNGVLDVDCALYNTNLPSEADLFNLNTIVTATTARNPESITQYVLSGGTSADGLIDRDNQQGVIYVKDKNSQVKTIIDALPYISSKYTASVVNELSSGVIDFNMVYDTYFIQTSALLVVDKVVYSNGAFTSPTTPNVIYNYNANSFNKLSNRYKVDNYVYFTILSGYNTDTQGSQSIVPYIYKYNVLKNSITTVYPSTTSYVTDNTIPSNILYTEASQPVISYTPETKTFCLAMILKDQNKTPTLVYRSFKDNDNAFDAVYTNLGGSSNTTVFNGLTSLGNFIVPLSSQTIGFNNSAMIL